MTVWVPPVSFDAQETNLVNPAGPYGTLVASHATTAHTKNATYTELIASTAFDCYGILIQFTDVGGTNGTNSAMLVDLAIGAAASESVIIPNLNAGYAATSNLGGGQKYWFPLKIPAGSRLSATAQAAVVADDVRVSVWLWGKPNRPVWAGETVTTYGADTATSKGVQVTPGTSGAEGAWTQIVAATTKAHPYLAAGVGGNGATIIGTNFGFLDIGSGAATEQAIATNLVFIFPTAAETLYLPFPLSIFSHVASGIRLAARASIHATVGTPDVILYGVS